MKEAVSGRQGMYHLYLDPKSESGHSLLKTADSWIDVSAITLADLLDRHSIAECDFLKLDCEGAERDIVLETPIPVLRRIRRISLEYHAKILDNQALQSVFGRLDAAGFEVVAFNPDKLFLPILFERAE